MFKAARLRPPLRWRPPPPLCRALSSSSSTTTPTTPTPAAAIPDGAVVLSGIQPTGVPHLGNYLGALRQWRRLQDGAPAGAALLYSVVDLHAITAAAAAPQGPPGAALLRQWRRGAVAALLAVGLDPARCVVFFQSAVPAHAELMWILSCTASVGSLSRMTQWKSKLSMDESKSFMDDKVKKKLKLGLFSYPVLQAADVLVHRATHVPVGEDQKQHLEFARECATNFNAAYGQLLVPPETIISPSARVMSLRDPQQKMSKSSPNANSRILLTDTADEIRRKIAAAVTDPLEGGVRYDREARPGVANLLSLLSAFDPEGRTAAQLAEPGAFGGRPRGELKGAVADAVVRGLDGIRDRYLELLSRDGGRYLDEVALQGAIKARESAERTMREVREAMGLS
ncbi:hypothetical protein RB597_004526 [Gaeumannomyces tritici]